MTRKDDTPHITTKPEGATTPGGAIAPMLEAARRDGLLISPVRPVLPEWIDYNGHLNMAFYNVFFDQCVDDAFLHFGMGPDYAKRGFSFFTLEAHTTYVQEIHEGDETIVTLQIVDRDQKRVHSFLELYRVADGVLSATSEQMAMHVDMTAKKGAPFPVDIQARVDALFAQHEHLPRKPQLGHTIGIPRKAKAG